MNKIDFFSVRYDYDERGPQRGGGGYSRDFNQDRRGGQDRGRNDRDSHNHRYHIMCMRNNLEQFHSSLIFYAM